MKFSVTILGNNSATPLPGRHPTAQIINHEHRLFLADCGEGTQMQLKKYNIRIGKINHIFISHLHGDHFFGLIGLITTYHLFGRDRELHVYGPNGIEDIINIQLRASDTRLSYPLFFHVVNTEVSEQVYEDELLKVFTIPMKHRIPTCGYLFSEKLKDRNMKPGIVTKMQIPVEHILRIKRGADYTDEAGNFYANTMLTNDPLPPLTYAFCSDTAYVEATAKIIQNADLLYHEATFMKDQHTMAQEKYHSTTIDAATLALKANVKKLIIGHYSARYDDLNPLLQEAQSFFPDTQLALEGNTFEVGAENQIISPKSQV